MGHVVAILFEKVERFRFMLYVITIKHIFKGTQIILKRSLGRTMREFIFLFHLEVLKSSSPAKKSLCLKANKYVFRLLESCLCLILSLFSSEC